MTQKMTRLCFDPWEYLEFRVNGKISPCCFFPTFKEVFTGDLVSFRNNREFRLLRDSLLKGDLHYKCKTCPFKEMGTVDAFRSQWHDRFPDHADPLSPPDDIGMVRIDLTERCNLRCTYCLQSQADYEGIVDKSEKGTRGGREMDRALLETVTASLQKYLYPIREISVNGHGETTCFTGWHQYCDRLLADGQHLSITSNFAKSFSPGEIATLAGFTSIAVSIDTADPVLLKNVRRKVDLGVILANIYRIRAKALSEGTSPPSFTFISGIYDKNVLSLTEFAWFAVACDVSTVNFWKLVKQPDVPGADNVYPVSTLDNQDFDKALQEIKSARDILESHHVTAVFTGNIIAELEQRRKKRVKLRLRQKEIQTGNLFSGIVDVIPDYPDPLDRLYLYVVLQMDERLWLVCDENIVPWEVEQDATPYATIVRMDHELSIEVPLDRIEKQFDTDEMKLYIGWGETIFDVIRYSDYITCSVS